jgi:hypothetical protein
VREREARPLVLPFFVTEILSSRDHFVIISALYFYQVREDKAREMTLFLPKFNEKTNVSPAGPLRHSNAAELFPRGLTQVPECAGKEV